MQKIVQIEGLEVDKLKGWFMSIQSQIERVKNNLQPKEPTQYQSRKEVAEMLGVTTVTISDWTKKGILESYKIGNRVYYKRHEVEGALVKIKSPKANG